MRERALNFLSNWIDANVYYPADVPLDDVETIGCLFLTDAVAAGITLDAVNDIWDAVERDVKVAIRACTSLN